MVGWQVDDVKGLVCNIERFATHDGPGIRTTVFLKGCPLECVWCSSPHTRKQVPELLHYRNRCESTGACVGACPEAALELSPATGLKVDRGLCTGCGECVAVCPTRALEVTGETMTVEELFREIDKDSSFYRRSGGGVTVSGGELMMQAKFVAAFLERCREQFIHTAIETSGFSKWKPFAAILRHVDLLYLDIKHMDEVSHAKVTGVSNDLMLENARRASEICTMVVRIPVVPGYNDSNGNIRATARFAAGLGSGFQHIELLPYHRLGTDRYAQLGLEYPLAELQSPDDEHMRRLQELIRAEGIAVEIVG